MWYICFERYRFSNTRTGRTELVYCQSGKPFSQMFLDYDTESYVKHVKLEKIRKQNELFITLKCHEGQKKTEARLNVQS